MPSWYGTTPDGETEYVLGNNAVCDSDDLDINNQGPIGATFNVFFTSYSGPGTGTLMLTCSNYKNPVYPKDVSGFSIRL